MRVGVQNYREYEERHLEKAKRAQQQRHEFETQIGHLKAQLEYETSRDVQKPIDHLEEKMKADAALLERLAHDARSAETRQRKVGMTNSLYPNL